MKKALFAVAAALLLLTVSCELIDDRKVPVTGVSISESSLNLLEGQSAQLKAIILPDNATNKNVTWNSSNEKVATVDNGNVTAVSAGEALVKVVTDDGGLTALCKVLVTSKDIPSIPVESVSLDCERMEMNVGDTAVLVATILPADATNRNLTWASSNDSIAAVSQNGLIEAVAPGQAIIVVMTEDGGKSAECIVTVVVPEMSIGKLSFEALPNFNMPRSGHVMFYDYNNRLIALGGHSDGFYPTSTAEILKDNEWSMVDTYYSHDMPFSVFLSSGKVMIGGGCSSGSGVGQSSCVEIYDPETGAYTPTGNMNYSRTEAHAVRLANGNVMVSGNWYSSDCIEMYSPENGTFQFVSEVSQPRVCPYIFETAENKGIVFGVYSNYGYAYGYDEISVDRFDGTSYNPEVFSKFIPFGALINFRPETYCIGEYTYLIPARDSEGQVSILKLQGEEFSVVETDFPIPMYNPEWDLDLYWSSLIVDKAKQVAYLMGGSGSTYDVCIATIDYSPIFAGGKAKVSLSYSDRFDERISLECCVLTPEGNIVIGGGIYDSNFSPFSNCYIIKP